MGIVFIILGVVAVLAVIALYIIGHKAFTEIFLAKHDFTNSAGRYTNKLKLPYMGRIEESMEYARNLEHERISITSVDGLKLSARLYKRGNDKAVILMHGYRSKSEYDFGYMLDFYIEEGFDIIMPDQRAHGMSEGKYITFGIKESYDCALWSDFAADELGYKEIVIVGVSMGASTAMMAVKRGLNKSVKAIVSDCGFTSPKEVLERTLKKRVKIKAASLILHASNFFCCRPHGFNIYELSPMEAVKECELPILFLHGLQDDFVPCEMGRENFEVCASDKKELYLVDKCDHAMAFIADEEGVKEKERRLFAQM